jgi:oligopeptide/dipeptide ABC transporter ATP-binding protein
MPAPEAAPAGCRFQPRCPLAVERCRSDHPVLRTVGAGRLARCHRAEDMLAGALP